MPRRASCFGWLTVRHRARRIAGLPRTYAYVNAHANDSRPQPTREVPWDVFGYLRAGYVEHRAHELLLHLQPHGYEPGQPDDLQIPPSFGRVVAWLWEVSQADEAAVLIADYMACLRVHDELVDDSPNVRFDDVLRTLRHVLPKGTDAERLIQYLRAKVPGFYYGDERDPDTPDLNA